MAEGGGQTDFIKPFSRQTFQEKLDNIKKGQATPRHYTVTTKDVRIDLKIGMLGKSQLSLYQSSK